VERPARDIERALPLRVDRVGATGALVSLAGCLLLPVYILRANRIVSGAAQPLAAGGPAVWAFVLLAAIALGVTLLDRGPSRARVELACAAGMLASLAWALGYAAANLTPDPASSARVSIGSGAWLSIAGAATLWFAATRPPVGRMWRAGAAAFVAAAWLAAGPWGGLWRLSILRLAIAIGVPLGILASRVRWVRAGVLAVVGLIQTIPSLALLGLLVLPLAALGLPGIGPLPAVIALTLYALLPIVRNTYLGLAHVDASVVDAGLGMGMSRYQLLVRVEAPLALPLVIEGIRAAAVMTIGIAAVVAFIGVGTLGVLIVLGMGYQADDLILLGAVPMVLMAIAADAVLRALGHLVTSPGIRVEAP
jgi:osmoprotectant transport system permease protein